MINLSEGLQTEEELRREDRATRERIERFAAAADKIHNTEVRESSPRGEVRVTVTTSGALRRIELGAPGARLAAAEIVTLVQECIQRAQRRIIDVAQQVLADEVGADPSAQLVLDDYRNRFPSDVQAEPPAKKRTPDEQEQSVLQAAWSNDGGWA